MTDYMTTVQRNTTVPEVDDLVTLSLLEPPC